MPARILYVDDEDDIREIAQMSLELDPQFEVRSCASGVEALTDAADWQPDLILLDVMMPETLQRLAGSPLTASIPVVFITARTQTHQVERISPWERWASSPNPSTRWRLPAKSGGCFRRAAAGPERSGEDQASLVCRLYHAPIFIY